MIIESIRTITLPNGHTMEAFMSDTGLRILKSNDHTHHGPLLHISISRPDRYPDWDEIVEVKLHFFGDDKDAMMVIPKTKDYVNISENCFHIWETPKEWNIR